MFKYWRSFVPQQMGCMFMLHGERCTYMIVDPSVWHHCRGLGPGRERVCVYVCVCMCVCVCPSVVYFTGKAPSSSSLSSAGPTEWHHARYGTVRYGARIKPGSAEIKKLRMHRPPPRDQGGPQYRYRSVLRVARQSSCCIQLGAASARPASFGGGNERWPWAGGATAPVTSPFWAKSVIISGSDKINQHRLWSPCTMEVSAFDGPFTAPSRPTQTETSRAHRFSSFFFRSFSCNRRGKRETRRAIGLQRRFHSILYIVYIYCTYYMSLAALPHKWPACQWPALLTASCTYTIASPLLTPGPSLHTLSAIHYTRRVGNPLPVGPSKINSCKPSTSLRRRRVTGRLTCQIWHAQREAPPAKTRFRASAKGSPESFSLVIDDLIRSGSSHEQPWRSG